ncbi:MAG: protein YgfX [Pseudomonadota bacterium]
MMLGGTLILQPRPSRTGLVWLRLVHGLGVLALAPLLAAGSGMVVAMALLALGVSYWHGLRRDWLMQARTSIRRAEWRDDSTWFLQCGGHSSSQPTRLRHALVSRPLVILAFSWDGLRPRYLVLWPDSLDPTLLRHLRVRLRWGERVPRPSTGEIKPSEAARLRVASNDPYWRRDGHRG